MRQLTAAILLLRFQTLPKKVLYSELNFLFAIENQGLFGLAQFKQLRLRAGNYFYYIVGDRENCQFFRLRHLGFALAALAVHAVLQLVAQMDPASHLHLLRFSDSSLEVGLVVLKLADVVFSMQVVFRYAQLEVGGIQLLEVEPQLLHQRLEPALPVQLVLVLRFVILNGPLLSFIFELAVVVLGLPLAGTAGVFLLLDFLEEFVVLSVGFPFEPRLLVLQILELLEQPLQFSRRIFALENFVKALLLFGHRVSGRVSFSVREVFDVLRPDLADRVLSAVIQESTLPLDRLEHQSDMFRERWALVFPEVRKSIHQIKIQLFKTSVFTFDLARI